MKYLRRKPLQMRQAFAQWIIAIITTLVVTPVMAEDSPQLPFVVHGPNTLSAPVNPGLTQVELPFTLGAVESLKLEIIAPVDGVELTVLDPDGVAVYHPGDPAVRFFSGELLNPKRPGGQFTTPTMAQPKDGDWLIRLNFPAATEKTVILATLYTATRYQVGIPLSRSEYRVGQALSLSMLVLRDQAALLNLSPRLTVTAPSGQQTTLDLFDDGDIPAHADVFADDGTYSTRHTFQEPGEHVLEGVVDIPTDDGRIIQREARRTVEVYEKRMELTDIETSLVTGHNNCVEAINVQVSAETFEPFIYLIDVVLKDSAGNTIIDGWDEMISTAGPFDFSITFNAEDIRENLEDGPYSIHQIDILSEGNSNSSLEFRTYDFRTFDTIQRSDLCFPPIHIERPVSVTEHLSEGYIDSLDLAFLMRVHDAGSYSFAIEVVDGNRESVDKFYFDQNLQEGENSVQVTLTADQLQAFDGPFSISSVSGVSPGGIGFSERNLGETDAYSKWQFYPTREGDLNLDGVVDSADRDLLLEYRNQPALVPGDRRDVTGDGMINGADARYLLHLR